MIAPAGQKFITSAFALPRTRAGMNSAIAALMIAYSAPTPSAARNRNP